MDFTFKSYSILFPLFMIFLFRTRVWVFQLHVVTEVRVRSLRTTKPSSVSALMDTLVRPAWFRRIHVNILSVPRTPSVEWTQIHYASVYQDIIIQVVFQHISIFIFSSLYLFLPIHTLLVFQGASRPSSISTFNCGSISEHFLIVL